MSRSPAEVIRTVASEEVLNRLESWFEYYQEQMMPRYSGIHLNLKLLRHAAESCFLDISRMKSFHGIEFADCHKWAAFTMLWIAKAHPIQIDTDANMKESLLVINEIYGLNLGLAHLEIDLGSISSRWYRNMLYILHFRNAAPEVLASSMYVLERAMKNELP